MCTIQVLCDQLAITTWQCPAVIHDHHLQPSLQASRKRRQRGSWQDVANDDYVIHRIHLTMPTRIAGTAVAKWHSHMTLGYMTTLL